MESSNNFSATLFKVLGYIFFFAAFAYLGMTLTNFITNGEGLIGEEQFQYIKSFYLVVTLFTSINLVFSGIFILIGNLIQKVTDVEIHLKSIAIDFSYTAKSLEKNFTTDFSQEKYDKKDENLSDPGAIEELALNDQQEASQTETDQTAQVPAQ
ncbi:MAG TPA: hypothetical protein DGJ56_00965 [Verrucomicrobiales bacterium]|nr:hypothetical protein [Verrucomicrobiales bacterium]